MNEADLIKAKSEGGEMSLLPKKQVKCKHWPKCNFSEQACEFFHPTETCKFFPKCQYGENKCMFIHPEIICKFGDFCTRANCAYKHSAQKQQAQQFMMNPLLMGMAGGFGG